MRNSNFAALIAASLLSYNVQAVDLLQIYKEALADDAQFASARATLAAGQEKLPQARAGLLPTIGLGGSYNRTGQDATALGVDSHVNYSANTFAVSLTQPLFRWANWEQYQQGKLAVAASEAQFAQAQQDLIVRVAQAYFDVLAAQDALASVQAQKVAITEQLASAKRNFEVGTATITDTHEAQARYDLAIAQEFAGQNDLAIKLTALQQIIGKPTDNLAPLRTGVQLSPPQPAQMDKWVDGAETQNYGVIGQQLALEIARREIKKNRAAHTPTLDLVASRSHINQTGSSITPIASTANANTIGVQWAIPLFAGFAIDSKVRESIALEEKARDDLENARRSAAQGARQFFLSVNNGLAQVKALEAAEVSSQSALDSNKLGYQVGVRINIDVLNAQQQLYSTRRDLAKARYDTILNGLRLESAAGILKEDDLVKVNSLLTDRPPGAAETGSSPAANQPSSGAQIAAAKPVSSIAAPAAPIADPVRDEVLDVVNAWAMAWSTQDVEKYFEFYGSDFRTPRGASRKKWEQERRARIVGKKHVEVKIEAPQVTLNDNTATVKFRQIYQSDSLASESMKTLILNKQDGKWRIKQELSDR